MSEKSADDGFTNDPLNEIFSGPGDGRDLAEMVARDGKPVITRFTISLGLAAIFLGGIIAGTYLQSSSGAATGNGSAASAFASFASGQGTRASGGGSAFSAGGFGGGTGGFGAPVAAGQIKLIDGTNLYVTTATGSIVKVATDITTRIRKTATLTIGQLKVGDTVSVSGQDGADGTVTATAINVGGLPGSASTTTPSAKPPSASATAKSASPAPSASSSRSPSVAGTNRFAALTACLTKKGIKVDPTQGARALRNSTDPKIQAAFAACRTSAFPSGGASPTP